MLWVLRFAASLRNKGEYYCGMNGVRRQAQFHVLQPVSIVASAASRVPRPGRVGCLLHHEFVHVKFPDYNADAVTTLHKPAFIGK